MTTKELLVVKAILLKIRNKDAWIAEAIAYLDKDLAIRNQQRKEMLDNRADSYEWPGWGQ